MSGYNRGNMIPSNHINDSKKNHVQQTGQGYNANYSQYSNQPQLQQTSVNIDRQAHGRRDEWDSFFSQETAITSNTQQQMQQNAYQQKGPVAVVLNAPNPIDRASQLLRSLNQTSDSNVSRVQLNSQFPSNVADNYQSSIPVNSQHQQQYSAPQNIIPVMKQQPLTQQIHVQQAVSNRFDGTNDFQVQSQPQQQYSQTQQRYNNYTNNQNDYYTPSDNVPTQYGQQQVNTLLQQSRTLIPPQNQGGSVSQQMYAANVSSGYNQMSNDSQNQGSYQNSQPQIRQTQQQQTVVPSQGYSQYGSGNSANSLSFQQQQQQQQQQQPNNLTSSGGMSNLQQSNAIVNVVGNNDISRYGLNMSQQQQQPQAAIQQGYGQQIQNVLQNVGAFNAPTRGARNSRFNAPNNDNNMNNSMGGGGHRNMTQGNIANDNFSPIKRQMQQHNQTQNKYQRTENTNINTGRMPMQSNRNFNQQQQSQQQQQQPNRRGSNTNVTQNKQSTSYGGRDRDSTTHIRRSHSNDKGRIPKRQPAAGVQGAAVAASADHRRRSRTPSRERKRERGSSNKGEANNGTGGTQTNSSNRRIDYSKLLLPNMIEFYNAAVVGRNVHVLSPIELFSRFPNLYVPADLVRIEIDWHSLVESLQADIVRNIFLTASAEITNQPATIVDDALLSHDPPKFTNITPTEYQSSSMFSCCSRMNFNEPKSIKFNARVLITFGMNNSTNERIDFNLPKKLRVLIGKRKQNVMLLGGSWSSELDGGDPMRDRSCLLNTARRCVLAQSMVDINMYCRYLKMCEILYQRPKEEIKGKLYPEQDEITIVYLCMVQPQLDITSEEFDSLWGHYCSRVEGKEVGPIMGMDAETSSSFLLNPGTVVTTESSDSFVESAASSSDIDISPHESNSCDIENTIEVKSEESIAGNGESIIQTSAGDIAAEVITDKDSSVHENKVDHDEVTVKTEEGKSLSLSINSKSPTAQAISTTTHLIKPDKPCVLICPMPLNKELGADPIRRLEGVSVKLLTLSQILSYSEDDSNERIFEASVAAELLRSLIATDYADIVTDFVMSEYTNMTFCGDPRVYAAVKTLRKMAKNSTAISKVRTGSIDNTESKKDDKVTVNTEATAHTFSETNIAEKSDAISLVDLESSSSLHADVLTAAGDSASAKDVTDIVEMNSNIISEDRKTNHDLQFTEDSIVNTLEADKVESKDDSESEEQLMKESEAREWRRMFLNACRWFDIDQQRSLRQDHLELILYSSTRDISRAELCAAAWSICKDEKLRYEIHI